MAHLTGATGSSEAAKVRWQFCESWRKPWCEGSCEGCQIMVYMLLFSLAKVGCEEPTPALREDNSPPKRGEIIFACVGGMRAYTLACACARGDR